LRKLIAIVGGGSAALMLAAQLDKTKFSVAIYEKNAALGRKFLVAGDGGFNLTHSENLESFINRYSPAGFIAPVLKQFSNTDLRNYVHSLGIETYVGTSKRVFPVKGIKPIDVLNAFVKKIKTNEVQIFTQHAWKGWTDKNELLFEHKEITKTIKADIVVYALGGASWNVTGSDGKWMDFFQQRGIETNSFQASNCAYQINWSDSFLKTAEGKSLKNISITCRGKSKKGEVVITKFGIEGGAVYALSPEIRNKLSVGKEAQITMDLKPVFSEEEIYLRLQNKGNKSIGKLLKDDLNLSSVATELLKTQLNKTEFTDTKQLSKKIKALPLVLKNAAPIDEAISTVGGISLNEIDADFQLKKMPNNYTIGEMLDWDAPTGGYLLQACLSMGFVLAKKLNATH
jgi:uncharacterized flavoprotein (TIGR03862 family)